MAKLARFSVSLSRSVRMRITIFSSLTFCIDSVSCENCIFDEIAWTFVDWVNDVVVVSGFVLAARHSYKEVVGFDYLDFVDCNAAVNCQGSDCFQISSSEWFSEFDVWDFHVGIYLSFFKFSGLIRPLITLRSAPCDDKPLVKFQSWKTLKIIRRCASSGKRLFHNLAICVSYRAQKISVSFPLCREPEIVTH